MSRSKQESAIGPASPAFGLVSTAVLGALPLIDASQLSDTQRRAVHIATAAVAGVYVGITVGAPSRSLVPLRVVAGLAASGLALRFADLSDAIDARLEQKLRRAGVRHPRRWMAAVAAASTFAAFLGDRAAAASASSSSASTPITGQRP